MTTMTPLERVQRGVALLDLHGPAGWRAKINLDTLDIRSSITCPLGQIFGTYPQGADFLRERSYELRRGLSSEWGFDTRTDGSDRDNTALVAAWTQVLASSPAVAEKPRIELTREMVELLAERFAQIDDSNDPLWSAEFQIDGVIVSLR